MDHSSFHRPSYIFTGRPSSPCTNSTSPCYSTTQTPHPKAPPPADPRRRYRADLPRRLQFLLGRCSPSGPSRRRSVYAEEAASTPSPALRDVVGAVISRAHVQGTQCFSSHWLIGLCWCWLSLSILLCEIKEQAYHRFFKTPSTTSYIPRTVCEYWIT